MTWLMEAIKRLLGIGMPCMFHSVTGLYCPGCGGTRAVRCLFKGDLTMSLQYHPLVLYVGAVTVLEIGSWALSRVLKKPGLYLRHYHFFTLLGAWIIVVNWIYKNYMLIFQGVDLLPLFQ